MWPAPPNSHCWFGSRPSAKTDSLIKQSSLDITFPRLGTKARSFKDKIKFFTIQVPVNYNSIFSLHRIKPYVGFSHFPHHFYKSLFSSVLHYLLWSLLQRVSFKSQSMPVALGLQCGYFPPVSSHTSKSSPRVLPSQVPTNLVVGQVPP